MLPGLDGFSVCRRVREMPEVSTTPIIMLTAKCEERDVVRGLELGADDYIVKPFSRHVLLARENFDLTERIIGDIGRKRMKTGE